MTFTIIIIMVIIIIIRLIITIFTMVIMIEKVAGHRRTHNHDFNPCQVPMADDDYGTNDDENPWWWSGQRENVNTV